MHRAGYSIRAQDLDVGAGVKLIDSRFVLRWKLEQFWFQFLTNNLLSKMFSIFVE